MNRRGFAAGALAIAAAGCRRAAPPDVPLVHATAEQLLDRARDAGAQGRVTALHFWATWCGPCIEEFPLLEQEWRGWMRGEPRLDFLAVSVDEVSPASLEKLGREAAQRERDEAVKRFVREQRATFPIGIAVATDPDSFAATIDEGWPAVLPTTLLFGLDGKLSWRNLGELRVSRFRDEVRNALAASP